MIDDVTNVAKVYTTYLRDVFSSDTRIFLSVITIQHSYTNLILLHNSQKVDF